MATTYAQDKARILSDPSASFWIRTAIAELEKRDVCDVVADCRVLLAIVTQRMQEALHQGEEA